MPDSAESPGYRLAVDIGGTFTDLVIVDDEDRPVGTHKVLTEPDNLLDAVLVGIKELVASVGAPRNKVTALVHGTTLVANTLISRDGARTALLTTEGFRDLIEIGREGRYDLYDLDLQLPAPLVPRDLRMEVPERILATGEIRTPLDENAVMAVAERLVEANVESLAILFLHAYRWPQHERRAAELISSAFPDLDVTLSSNVLPQMGEYFRASTTVANAYVRPVIRTYLDDLESRLIEFLPAAALLLITSAGLVVPARTISASPIRLLESGPAGGVIAASSIARREGVQACLAFDMGGTTAKSSYVVGGTPRLANSFEVARVKRYAKGSGLPIQMPSVELIESGAGGGSIAWVDPLGLLRVGPQSAAGDPGPACYGLGGTEPTVTDANLVLGYLDTEFFLGGRMKLQEELAVRALEDLAKRLELPSALDAAKAMRRVVDEQMAQAARRHATEQGLDPSVFALVATGGAGPMHACSIARLLGITTVIVPSGAGVASASGFLAAPYGFNVARSAPSLVADLDWNDVRALLDELREEALATSPDATGETVIEVDLRFRGQGGEGSVVTVPIPENVVSTANSGAVQAIAESAYDRRYGRVPDQVQAEVLTWRVAVRSELSEIGPIRSAVAPIGAPKTREVFHVETGRAVWTPVVHWSNPGHEGPAIVQQEESTVVIPPGAQLEMSASGSLVITLKNERG